MDRSGEALPSTLRPPLEGVLAKAVEGIPAPAALPGQMLFEPKFDGYRVLIFRDRDRVSLWSRQGKNLTRYFPDLAEAAGRMLPPASWLMGKSWCGRRGG